MLQICIANISVVAGSVRNDGSAYNDDDGEDDDDIYIGCDIIKLIDW